MKPQLLADVAAASLMLMLYVLWPIGSIAGVAPWTMVFAAAALAGILVIAKRANYT